MVYLSKHSIAVSTTGAATNEDYSADVANGLIYAIEYTPGTLPSTAAWSVARAGASTHLDAQFLTSVSASTDKNSYWPRHSVIDSTQVTIGATTDYPVAMYHIAGERIKLTTVGATSEGGTATVDVYVQGG